MKFTIFAIVFIFSINLLHAQNGFYVGYENGCKWDQYQYLNSKGYSLNKYQFDGVWGGYIGYRLNNVTLETGFYGYYTSSPYLQYNYATGAIEKTYGSFGSSSMDSWTIPLRFGNEFLFLKDRLFFKPELAFTTMIARDYSVNQPGSTWGENTRIPGDSSYIPSSADSTKGFCYRSSKINFGIETSISAGYRFKKRADVYLKASYVAGFSPVYYEILTHYSATENVNATKFFNGNSILMQIGLRFYFGNQKTD